MAKKNTIIPPSLQPRKLVKKSIPGSNNAPVQAIKEVEAIERPAPPPVTTIKEEVVYTKEAPIQDPPKPKVDKKRFTLWLNKDVYRSFKVKSAELDISASEYIERLIRKDLSI